MKNFFALASVTLLFASCATAPSSTYGEQLRKPSGATQRVALGQTATLSPGDVALVEYRGLTSAVVCGGGGDVDPGYEEISAQRSVSPMMQMQCKDQRGMAHSAVEKELEAGTQQAEEEFQRKCRSMGAGRRCFGPTFEFNYAGNPQLYNTTGTCTVKVYIR